MMTIEERFWAKVDRSGGPDACWLWTAYLTSKGHYGRFGIDARRKVLAHRFAYELTYGPLPAEVELDHRHTCPKRCCNPTHVRPVTHKQNQENRSRPRVDNTSGAHGVTFDRLAGRWAAKVMHNGTRHWVGRFDTVEAADQAVRAKRLELFTHNDIDLT